jgi:kynurenine formamidase
MTPGAGVHGRPVDVECARWLAEDSLLIGIGVETVGIDAGAAGEFDSPLPLHYYLLGAGKYGVTQLANHASLPPTGALLVDVAPLKLTGGTGRLVRALALVPRG